MRTIKSENPEKTLRFEIIENESSKDNIRWLVCYFGKPDSVKPPLKKVLAKINQENFKKMRNKSFTSEFIFKNSSLVNLLEVQKIELSEEEKDKLLSSVRIVKENFGTNPKIKDDILNEAIENDLLEPLEIPETIENLEGADEEFDSFFQDEFGINLN